MDGEIQTSLRPKKRAVHRHGRKPRGRVEGGPPRLLAHGLLGAVTLTAAGHGSPTALTLTAMGRLPKVLLAIR